MKKMIYQKETPVYFDITQNDISKTLDDEAGERIVLGVKELVRGDLIECDRDQLLS